MTLISTAAKSSGTGSGLALIGSVSVSGTPLTIDFASIPATYTHLMMFAHLRQSNAATLQTATVRFNGDTTATAYISEAAQGTNLTLAGADSIAGSSDLAATLGASASAGLFGGSFIVLPFYTAAHSKTWHYMTSAVPTTGTKTGAFTRTAGGVWVNNAAISSLSLSPDAFAGVVTWVAGSIVTLYGI